MVHSQTPVIKENFATTLLRRQKIPVIIVLSLVLTGFFCKTDAQTDTLKVVSRPQVIEYNSGFDVIITVTGDIIYGIVKEVTLDVITYKRTDIPDGPVYTMLRSEVYAISYRNQVKEYFSPAVGAIAPAPVYDNSYTKIDYKREPIFKHAMFRLSLGALKTITKLDDSKTYASSGTFPSVNIGYDADFKNRMRLGLQIGFGSRKFSKQDYSSYDSLQNNITVKENIFSMAVYTKYSFMQPTSRLQPYVIGGLGINSSRINASTIVTFTNNNSQSLIVTSGTRSTSLGILLRGGAEYYINNQLLGFLDVGTGLSVFNVGLAINLK